MNSNVYISHPAVKIAREHTTRKRIFKLLQKKDATVLDMITHLRIPATTIRHHLSILIRADIVKMHESTEKWKVYSLISQF